MRGHFRYLRFKTFLMTPRTPQCEVFWAFLSNSKHSGVPEDSKSPTLGVLGFTLTLGQSGVATSEHSATGSTPFQMVTGKSPIVPMIWAAQGQPPSDASEEVPMVTQLDEERQHLWEVAKANSEKAHKRYEDFANKSRREVKF